MSKGEKETACGCYPAWINLSLGEVPDYVTEECPRCAGTRLKPVPMQEVTNGN